MSNYALQNQLGSLESELRQLEQINNHLRGELSTVSGGVSRANSDLQNYNAALRNNLENCNNSIHSSHQRVVDSLALQGEIEKLYARFKQIELANKKIRECNNKKYYDFANYRTVRKIVQGIMDNLDVQMVSDKTIMKSVEVQHLQIPDYWLTCVLISIMAWRNDDRELADRATARAMKLDKKQSAVFYMLFNLRVKREKAALKWFYTYQECEFKGSDQRTFLMLFSMISKTLVHNVDEDTREEIFSFIKKVVDSNMRSSGYSEEGVIDAIKEYLKRMASLEQFEFSQLRKYCDNVQTISSILFLAKNNINILEFILKTLNVPEQEKNTFLKSYIDELILMPNLSEKEIYNEIDYNELIIKHEGLVSEAKEEFEAKQQRSEKELNLIQEMIDWIYERECKDINPQIKLNMFMITKKLHEKAIASYVEDYRSLKRTEYPVHIKEYNSNVNFDEEEGEYQKILNFYTEIRDAQIAQIKKWYAYVAFGLAAVAVPASYYAGLWLLIVSLAAVVYGIFSILNNKAQVKNLEKNCDENIKSVREIMGKIFSEFRGYTNLLDEYDGYYDRIKDEFAKI